MSTLILTSTGLSDEKVREAIMARMEFLRDKKVAGYRVICLKDGEVFIDGE